MASPRHAFTVLAIAALLACGTPQDDGADAPPGGGGGGTSGFCAAERPATCGDGACRADQGETPDSCRRDCVPESCGDGDCEAGRGETAANCSEDCNDVCLNAPSRPVYCRTDGGCWEEGTDCCAEVLSCGAKKARCGQGGQTVHCCGDFIAKCGVGTGRYFCPAPGMNTCVASADQCPVPVCQVLATCGPRQQPAGEDG